jgi:aminodeoxyfutalosine deaminase
VASLEEHPLRDFVAAGVTVTINSDDPPMFGTTLNQEYAVAAGLLGLDAAGVADLARAAVTASFADESTRARVLADIDAHLGAHESAAGPGDGR